METIRFDDRPKLPTFALAGLFFVGCGVIIAKLALENDRGLLISRLVRLDTADATFVLWALTGACVLFVLGAMLGIIRAFGAPRAVELNQRMLAVPAGLRGASVTIRYADITDLKITQIQSQKFSRSGIVVARWRSRAQYCRAVPISRRWSMWCGCGARPDENSSQGSAYCFGGLTRFADAQSIR